MEFWDKTKWSLLSKLLNDLMQQRKKEYGKLKKTSGMGS